MKSSSGLPSSSATMVQPADTIFKAMERGGALSSDAINSILKIISRGQGPRIIVRVRRGLQRANTAANREADVDCRTRTTKARADREAREGEDGEVGSAKRASAANRSSIEGEGKSKAAA